MEVAPTKKQNDTEALVGGVSYQCMKCDSRFDHKYDPEVPYEQYNEDRVCGLFTCNNCGTPCPTIAQFKWEERLELKTSAMEKETDPLSFRVTHDDIKFVLETLYKEAANDKPSIDQLFFGMCSAFTKCGMSHDVNSPSSGAGKNYLLKLVSSLFPKKYIEQFAGVSDKAFFHRRGKMVVKNEKSGKLETVELAINVLEEEKSECEVKIAVEKDNDPKRRDKKVIRENRIRIKEIDRTLTEIKNRWQKLIVIYDLIIILLDTPQEGFFANLMSLVSGDTGEDQEYLFTDKTSSGKNEATSNIIRGRPTMFIAHVADDTWSKRFAEKNRRFIPVTPDTSKEKINDAMRLMSKKAGLLPEQYGEQIVSEDDKVRARMIVAAIVEKLRHHSRNFKLGEYGISIPFHAALAESILADKDGDVWRMTVKKRIEEYLGIITKVFMDNGPRLVNVQTGVSYPIATFAGLSKTLEIMERGGTNIKSYLVDFYNRVFLPRFQQENGLVKGDEIEKENHVGLTTEEIGQAMQKLGIPYPGSKLLRDTYLYPLSNCGLLDYEKSILNRSQNLWFPTDLDANTNAFKLFKDDDRKLGIEKEFYPDVKLIEVFYRSIVRDAEDSVDVQQKKLYLLEDADGTEISVNKMIDKYFSNPEMCFKIAGE
jgi:hypothetical protein